MNSLLITDHRYTNQINIVFIPGIYLVRGLQSKILVIAIKPVMLGLVAVSYYTQNVHVDIKRVYHSSSTTFVPPLLYPF